MDSPPPPNVPWYHRSVDLDALCREFPPPPDFVDGVFRMPRDALRELQDARFREQVARAWRLPFYQRHWDRAGIAPGDIRSLDDLESIPPFSVHDLRESLERNPPFGDLIAIDAQRDEPMPLVLHTSGGTTGLPRPMLYGPRDREVMSIMTGRRMYMQGVRPYDVVQIVFSMGLGNGGMIMRDGIWKYSGAIPAATGSGEQTSTRRQIELIQAWKTRFLIGFPGYLRHMGLYARDELGLEPASLGIRGLIAHVGVDDRKALEDLWGADLFDNYGLNECGSVGSECAHKSGIHMYEDAYLFELLDPESMCAPSPGGRGVIFLTTLYKHIAPLIRFNTNDVSTRVTGECACGSTHQRLGGIIGRADNMVKLRGTNVFPEAIGELTTADQRTNGEYICIVEKVDGRDEMTVRVESRCQSAASAELTRDLMRRFKDALGVRLQVEIVPVGSLDEMTGLTRTSKVRRLIDNRPQAPAKVLDANLR